MTPQAKPSPLSRPVAVADLPARGLDVRVDPTPAEREVLARDLGLAGIDRLEGRFRLTRNGRVVHVAGEVSADVQQVCVVSLEPFPAAVTEPVDVRFAEDARPSEREEEELSEHDLDAPEPLLGGVVDVGSLTAEFLALGLDPYPRKPGVSFDYRDPADEEPSPFAALSRLKGEES
ncbi:MAG: YceD family protein [Alsobacter sp.]